MKRERIAGSSVRVSRWRIRFHSLQTMNIVMRTTRTSRYHRRLWGGRRWNAVPTKRTLRNAVVVGGWLTRRQDGGFPCGRDALLRGRRWNGGPTMGAAVGTAFHRRPNSRRAPPGAARRDVSPYRGSSTLAASDDGLANVGSDRSVASPMVRLFFDVPLTVRPQRGRPVMRCLLLTGEGGKW